MLSTEWIMLYIAGGVLLSGYLLQASFPKKAGKLNLGTGIAFTGLILYVLIPLGQSLLIS